MSTNDEIRKALVEAAEQGMNTIRSLIHTLDTIDSDERSLARDERRSAHVHTSELRQSQAAHDKLASALAPYLVPHPAQQGEDSKRIDWLEAHHNWLLAAETEPAGTFSCGSNQNFQNWALKVPSVRAAIDAARSHSKQEGGA